LATRDIAVSGIGTLVIGNKQFDGIEYEISGSKRSRFDGAREQVLSAQLSGEIQNPEIIDAASKLRTLDLECRLRRNDGRIIAIGFFAIPAISGCTWSRR
jgi:hypothetical protein